MRSELRRTSGLSNITEKILIAGGPSANQDSGSITAASYQASELSTDVDELPATEKLTVGGSLANSDRKTTSSLLNIQENISCALAAPSDESEIGADIETDPPHVPAHARRENLLRYKYDVINALPDTGAQGKFFF